MPRGQVRFKFGDLGSKDGQFTRPRAVVVHEDLIYVADTDNNRICAHRRSDGAFRFKFGGDRLKRPSAIAIAGGFAFIIHQSFCAKFHLADRRFSGQFNVPTTSNGVAATNNRVFIANWSSVQVYDADGRELAELVIGLEILVKSVGIAVQDNLLFVADRVCISVFQTDGKFVRKIGVGANVRPIGIACGPKWVAISEDPNRISVFDSESGELISQFGKFGNADTELNSPAYMCWNQGSLLVADSGNNRIVVYE